MKRRYRLEELVEGITQENRHEATGWGRPVGLEVLD
jgi:antitoxin component of MazEF toxin-antitoxin module